MRCTGLNTYTVVNHNPDTVNGFAMRVEGSYTPKPNKSDIEYKNR